MSNEQAAGQATTQPRALPDGYGTWNEYWTKEHNQPWRTEPEIDEEQKHYLAERRRAIQPDSVAGNYPFRDIKLDRADVEWLLATHESKGDVGPVWWDKEKDKKPDQRREGLDLRGSNLQGGNLSRLPLDCLRGSLPLLLAHQLSRQQRRMAAIHLEGTDLEEAHLENAELNRAYLTGADLRYARLTSAVLYAAHLEGANLNFACLDGADLRRAFFDEAVYLFKTVLSSKTYGSASVVDVRWNGANLGTVQLAALKMLGDEQFARRDYRSERRQFTSRDRLDMFISAVRANKQFANYLRGQGLSEDASRFEYRAQLLQRQVLLRQGKLGRWLFSSFLALLSGYGYRLGRIIVAYILTLAIFALIYFRVGLPNEQAATTIQQLADAFQVSLTAIHGRVFIEQFGIGSILAWVAAVESVVGLVIEGVFTAMLVQRFFAR